MGKNAVMADREALKSTLTTERIIADAEEMTAWIRKRLGKEMLEEPGLFLLTLIQEVLPLTEGRAAFAPPR